ncbi:MAG: glycosyltransferase family 2 protein [Saprospiraceae bacterium]|nr:glycosyltransferase family 2 protein [Saprospiraceae bacterium]
MNIRISAVIITKNEVDRIATCIQSILPLTHDIIVVDSGSTDGTIAKAKELGAQVVQTEWKGFGATKNFGHTKAKYDWILSVDADESLSKELSLEIKNLPLEKGCVYAIDRKNYYGDQWIKYSGWSPDWVQRIFNKQEVQWNDNLVHEKLVLPKSTTCIKLNHKLEHHSYRSLDDHKEKIESYAALRAKIWFNTGKSPSTLKRIFGPIFKAFKSYILKLGFLDGKNGWIIAKMNAYLVQRQIHYYTKIKSEQS